jgi:hypothetical protein
MRRPGSRDTRRAALPVAASSAGRAVRHEPVHGRPGRSAAAHVGGRVRVRRDRRGHTAPRRHRGTGPTPEVAPPQESGMRVGDEETEHRDLRQHPPPIPTADHGEHAIPEPNSGGRRKTGSAVAKPCPRSWARGATWSRTGSPGMSPSAVRAPHSSCPDRRPADAWNQVARRTHRRLNLAHSRTTDSSRRRALSVSAHGPRGDLVTRSVDSRVRYDDSGDRHDGVREAARAKTPEQAAARLNRQQDAVARMTYGFAHGVRTAYWQVGTRAARTSRPRPCTGRRW